MRTFVTGAAGFIGFHLSRRLLDLGHTVVGIDNLNDYYSVRLKEDRLARLLSDPGFSFHRLDLADAAGLERLFAENAFSHVVNLAAQAGVRYSLQNPEAYVGSNLVGFANLLERCRRHPVEHLVFASSSSVYGLNTAMPFPRGTTRITRSACTPRPRRRMKPWPTATAICTASRAQVCAFSPYMARGAGRTWLRTSSPRPFLRAAHQCVQ